MARKDFRLVANVSINDIKLDTGNARIRTGRDQNECMSKILRKEDQMITLMSSIANEGLTTMPIIVKPDGPLYTVMDGNRRITALKLLNDPESCPVQHLQAKIRAIVKKASVEIPASLDVLSSDSEDAIAHEVLARHRGAAGGAGQLDWSAYLRTVYLINHGHTAEYKSAGQYAMWAEAQGLFVDDDFPITTLTRFFNKDNLKELGFSISKDKFIPNMAIESVCKMAEIVVLDFGANKKNVSTVFEPEQAQAYIAQVRLQAGVASTGGSAGNAEGDMRQKFPEINGAVQSGVPSKPRPPEQGAQHSDSPGEAVPVAAGAVGRATNTPKQHPSDRTKLFGTKSPNIAVPPEEVKAASLVAELRTLDLKGSKGTPYAAAFLLRGLLEVSDRRYREATQLKDQKKLAQNVRASATHMSQCGRLNDNQLDVVVRYTSGQDTLLQIENLQRMLHRETHIPDHHKLNTFWDELGCFVRACWAN